MDEDPGNESTNSRIQQIKSVLGEDKVLPQRPSLEGIFNFDGIKQDYGIDKDKFTKEIALKILPQWFENNEVPQAYKDLKEKLHL